MAKRSEVVKALDLHEEQLTRRPNVVGLGVVPAGGSPSDLAVGVYVVKKVPAGSLPDGEAIPESLPVTVRGRTVSVPTRVIEQGEVRAEREPPAER